MRDALHLEQGDVVEFTVTPDGDVKLRAMTTIPTDQRWFWTEEWQAGEREASADIAAGRTRFFESDEEFLAYLHDPDKS
ncbi:bifunctional DNA-binding transcriptional regulator/antitoxin component of YhaV-PrlF toxin-antitoxin module [Tenggerimyces flavus]|nr:bifunctional DNA-binding transcriptional regulator/antitoxin component of YhaV-PrlF toxin-antitoxin module [Tenggerimyces flavus]